MKTFTTLGLMSGTSGDGLDIACCTFKQDEDSSWTYRILASETLPFSEKLADQLPQAHTLGAEALFLLDRELGKWMGEVVAKFCAENKLKPSLIASHGHTVFHRPEAGISIQIGNPWALYAAAGIPVYADFRTLDVQLGGQGAPLVPIGDALLFGSFHACLNLGGIANVSFSTQGPRRAFDCSPFNLMLNHFAQKMGQPYDAGGAWAASGQVDQEALSRLHALPYYQRLGAKSLGREDMPVFFEALGTAINPTNALATLVQHFAQVIAASIPEAAPEKPAQILVTGGGAYNSFFMQQLAKALSSKHLSIFPAPAQLIEFKEALIFAFMAALKASGQVNTLHAVTGASRDSLGGAYYGETIAR
ncbi:MAG: anhydro-N-acetylmuramic acid kinase [Nitritalea sp.]